MLVGRIELEWCVLNACAFPRRGHVLAGILRKLDGDRSLNDKGYPRSLPERRLYTILTLSWLTRSYGY